MKIQERYKNITTSINTATSIVNLARQGKAKYNEKFMYTAVLDETAFVYADIMAYINSKTNTRNFRFMSNREGVFKYYDSESTITFYIGDHKIKANLNKPRGAAAAVTPDDDTIGVMTSLNKKDELTFTCSSIDGLNALENLLIEMGKKKQQTGRSNYLCMPTTYGDWDYESLPPKDMNSVFLPKGVKEKLIEDVEKFLSNEQRFLKLGLPYRRGYAFYGEPGNGKSSFALALANHFNLDLFNMALSSVNNDRIMSKAISEVRKNSILLLEDIDTYSAQISREQNSTSTSASTLGGLLNALDGVATPHGMITVMTTNKFETLDPALIRPGRMDYKVELCAPDQYQVDSMFEKIFEEPLGVDVKQFSSMAEVSDIFKRFVDEPDTVRLMLAASE